MKNENWKRLCSIDKIHRLMLSYQGDKDSNMLMERYVHELLPEHTKLEATFTSLYLSIEAKTSFEYQHNLMFYVNCTKPSCHNYIEQTVF